MPETIDLTPYRGTGLNPEDQEWKDDEETDIYEKNELAIAIQSMGFSKNDAM